MVKSPLPLQRIVFFGTPEFAVPTLEALAAAGRKPLLVVTQPDRPAGRGRKVLPTPVKAVAERLGIPVAQPESVKAPEFLERLAALTPDVAVVVAFGQIFPRRLLELPRAGCLNLHASLLPQYRGAAPIQAAIAAGEAVTGVTSMVMEAGLDTGPMLLKEETAIDPRETAPELAARLAHLGGALMVRTLEALEAGSVTPTPQEDRDASYAPRIRKEDGRVDWSLPARRLHDRLRAYTPWPGLTAELTGAPLKIVAAAPLPGRKPATEAAPAGTFLGLVDHRAAVACGEGSTLGLETVQRPGKKARSAMDFVNGERLEPGALLR
jgi:methionyl-tRNA formyltransferase